MAVRGAHMDSQATSSDGSAAASTSSFGASTRMIRFVVSSPAAASASCSRLRTL